MFKYINKAVLSLIISIAFFSASAIAYYDDVPSSSPYYYSIEYLRRNDVVPGTKLFKPESAVSRAEFIKYLVLLNSSDFKPAKQVKLPFEDTRDSAWYAPYFEEAIDLGILDKKTKKAYPDKIITVVEAIELLFHSKSIPIPKKYVGTIPYKDVAGNKKYQAMVMRASELGIIEPEKADYFGIFKKVTRQLAADMIFNMDMVNLATPQSSSQDISGLDPALQKIITSWQLINSSYINRDDIDQKDLTENAIKALVETLNDPYSAYMDEEENKGFSEDLDGQFEGIGAYIAIDDDGNITIVAPIKNTPADIAGIEAGDIIRKVDGFDTKGATLYETISRIKGPKGTKVKLTLERDGSTIVIEVTRDMINVESLEYEVVGGGKIMHVKITNFNQSLSQDFRELVEIITKDSRIKGVILDLRNNPGGLLDVAVDMLNYLLPNGSAAVQIKYNYFNMTQNTTGNGDLKDYPMAVLVNNGSASASEIVAGALKDYGIAKVIGETTFGKGTVQEVNYFNDNSSLKITVAKWLTSKGTSIEKNGIAPDITVAQGAGGDDLQLSRAVQEVLKMIQ